MPTIKELDLSRTCRTVADEMKGIHLQVNTITFTPCCLEREEDSFRGLRSLSARFEHLLHSVRWTKLLMLHYAAELVTEEVIVRVIEACPAMSSNFRAILRNIRLGNDFWGFSTELSLSRDTFCASFCEAVQMSLDLIADHPQFDHLISLACSKSNHYPGNRSPFRAGSHQQILAWRPDPWLIPTVDNLTSVEALLMPPDSESYDWPRIYSQVKFYFSATAIRIATLGRLTTEARKPIRSIILSENCRAVSSPDAHAEGLIPFCTENKQLRILMQAGFTTNLVPSYWEWAILMDKTTSSRLFGDQCCYPRILVDWLMRIAALPSRGMPSGSFVVDLNARQPKAALFWTCQECVAAKRLQLPQHLVNYDLDNPRRGPVPQPFTHTWRVPIQLAAVFKDIADGNSLIRLDILPGETWAPIHSVEECRRFGMDEFVVLYYMRKHEFPGNLEDHFRTYLHSQHDD